MTLLNDKDEQKRNDDGGPDLDVLWCWVAKVGQAVADLVAVNVEIATFGLAALGATVPGDNSCFADLQHAVLEKSIKNF